MHSFTGPLNSTQVIDDFSHFLSSVLVISDHVLRDFNIHVCCPSDALPWDFLNLIDSFNLTQSVMEPTHIHVHTLDLILTSAIPVPSVQINNSGLSDHWPIMFSTSLPCKAPKPSHPHSYSRSITPLTIHRFSDAFS